LKFFEGVRSIQGLVGRSTDNLSVPWPPEAVSLMAHVEIFQGFCLVQGSRVVGGNQVQGVLDQIRNRILSFVLEIESMNSEAGEPIMKSSRIPEEEVRNIFNTTIAGGVQNLAQGSHHVSQRGHIANAPGDIPELRDALRNSGITQNEIGDLESAIT